MAGLKILDDLSLAGGARNVGSQSWCWMISFDTTPAGMLARPANDLGDAERAFQLVFFSLRNGVMPPSGQVFMCGPLSVL